MWTRNYGGAGNTLARCRTQGGTEGKLLGVDALPTVKTFYMALYRIQCLEQIIIGNI